MNQFTQKTNVLKCLFVFGHSWLNFCTWTNIRPLHSPQHTLSVTALNWSHVGRRLPCKSQKDKDHYIILTHIYGIYKDGNDNLICKTEKEAQMYRTDFWTLWEKERVGCFKRTASEHVCYLGWNKSSAQVRCMRQVLRPGALGRPRGIGWRGRWEVGSGWGIHANPWLIHVSIWQKPLQYCKVISLQLIKKKKPIQEPDIKLTHLWINLKETLCKYLCR